MTPGVVLLGLQLAAAGICARLLLEAQERKKERETGEVSD